MSIKAQLLPLSFLFVSTVVAASPVIPLPGPSQHGVYISKQFSSHDGLTLNGHLALPSRHSEERPPVVLLLTDSKARNRYENLTESETESGTRELFFRPLEEALLSQGVAVFAYDPRGVAPEDSSFLTNRTNERILSSTTDVDLSADAVRAFDFLLQQPEIAPGAIAVAGHGESTATALRLVERFPGKVQALVLLNLFTRSYFDLFYFQYVTKPLRLFTLLDINQNEAIDESEYTPFFLEPGWWFNDAIQGDDGIIRSAPLPWERMLDLFRIRAAMTIPRSKWKSYFESLYEQVRPLVAKNYQDESFGDRYVSVCSKLLVFQGAVDGEMPAEDAIALNERCMTAGTSMRAFELYPDLGHGFSRRSGLRGWKGTLGPMQSEVTQSIAQQAARALGR